MFTFQIRVQTQSMFAYGSQVFAAGYTSHIFPGKRKKSGDTASYAACTGYEIFHNL